MKTFKTNSVIDSAKLHGELTAAGVIVETVRGQRVDDDEVSYCAVIVADDSTTQTKIDQVIAAHVPGKVPSVIKSVEEKNDVLAKMEKL